MFVQSNLAGRASRASDVNSELRRTDTQTRTGVFRFLRANPPSITPRSHGEGRFRNPCSPKRDSLDEAFDDLFGVYLPKMKHDGCVVYVPSGFGDGGVSLRELCVGRRPVNIEREFISTHQYVLNPRAAAMRPIWALAVGKNAIGGKRLWSKQLDWMNDESFAPPKMLHSVHASSLERSAVSPPAKFVRAAFRAGSDVETPVVVEVGEDDCDRVRPLRLDQVPLPGGFRVAGVLEPRNSSIRAPPRGNDILVSVAVKITRHGLEALGEIGRNRVFLPIRSTSRLSHVLIPGDLMRFP